MQEAVAQRQNGWWVCDGTTVSDPLAGSYNGKQTPNLADKLLKAASTAGTIGGSPTAKVEERQIVVHSSGFGDPRITQDPRLVVSSNLGWATGSSIHSTGTVPEQTLSITPPYYTAIYLMKVR
jgi:hypothetical protein